MKATEREISSFQIFPKSFAKSKIIFLLYVLIGYWLIKHIRVRYSLTAFSDDNDWKRIGSQV